MDRKRFEQLLPDYVLGMLSEEQNTAIETYVGQDGEAAALLQEWQEVNKVMESTVEASSESMDSKFYDMLHAEMEMKSNEKQTFWHRLFPQRPSQLIVYGAIAGLVLLLGFFTGKSWDTDTINHTPAIVSNEALEEATQETEDVRTQLVISLADQPSATKRLEALSEVSKLNNATDKVISALFKMLNSDPNINVRLAAVTSLSKYVENPKVREGLVMSITQQESPLVQIALAELMVTLKEQKSINSMETLLQKPETNEAVKQKLEESIKQII